MIDILASGGTSVRSLTVLAAGRYLPAVCIRRHSFQLLREKQV